MDLSAVFFETMTVNLSPRRTKLRFTVKWSSRSLLSKRCDYMYFVLRYDAFKYRSSFFVKTRENVQNLHLS